MLALTEIFCQMSRREAVHLAGSDTLVAGLCESHLLDSSVLRVFSLAVLALSALVPQDIQRNSICLHGIMIHKRTCCLKLFGMLRDIPPLDPNCCVLTDLSERICVVGSCCLSTRWLRHLAFLSDRIMDLIQMLTIPVDVEANASSDASNQCLKLDFISTKCFVILFICLLIQKFQ